jgi:hypothetical protein
MKRTVVHKLQVRSLPLSERSCRPSPFLGSLGQETAAGASMGDQPDRRGAGGQGGGGDGGPGRFAT